MCKKHIVKIVIALTLIVAVVSCSSFSVFAYRPVFSVLSSDWQVASDGTYSAVYPGTVPPSDGLIDEVYNHSEYNGQTYFSSDFWDDDFEKLQSTEFYFPAYPSSYYDNNVVVRIDDSYYLIRGFDEFVYVYSDAEALYYYTSLEQSFYIYKLSYPFSEWKVYATVDVFDTTLRYTKFDLPASDNGFEIVYSSVDVANYDHHEHILHPADTYVLQDQKQTIEYYGNMSVLKGKMSFSLTSVELKKFITGSYVLNWTDQGFIIGTATDFIYYDMSLMLIQDGVLLGTVPIKQHTVYDSDVQLEPGYAYPPETYMEMYDIDTDFDYENVVMVVSFVFVSTGYNLFFPGNIEFIRFEDYEEEQKHNAITDSLNTITGELEDLNENMPSAIKQELKPIFDDIKTEIKDGTVKVVESVDNASKSITEKLKDVGDQIGEKLTETKEAITEKLTEVKDGLLEGIKSFFIPSDEAMDEIDNKWDELLKSRFGALYEVSDIITDFASQMSWNHIKEAGEKNTITMPSVTVKLVDTDFTFGGYEISIVPEGFEVLTTALKGITSIVCTLMFVNALRRKYDKLVGGAGA